MSVKVLVDHGVKGTYISEHFLSSLHGPLSSESCFRNIYADCGKPLENKIVFVTFFAGKMGVKRLTRVFPGIKTVVGEIISDNEQRWVEKRYFGC